MQWTRTGKCHINRSNIIYPNVLLDYPRDLFTPGDVCLSSSQSSPSSFNPGGCWFFARSVFLFIYSARANGPSHSGRHGIYPFFFFSSVLTNRRGRALCPGVATRSPRASWSGKKEEENSIREKQERLSQHHSWWNSTKPVLLGSTNITTLQSLWCPKATQQYCCLRRAIRIFLSRKPKAPFFPRGDIIQNETNFPIDGNFSPLSLKCFLCLSSILSL